MPFLASIKTNCKQAETALKHFLKYYGWPIVSGVLLAIVLLQYQQKLAENSVRPINSFSSAVEKAMPAVVNIYTQRQVTTNTYSHPINPILQRFFKSKITPVNKIESSLGSGVIVSSDGYILTNHHVIKRADKVKVVMADGRNRVATVIGFDEPTDLAVIKVDITNASPLIFGNPNNVKIGDVVLAIGNPYGIGQTVTQGIVSATGRHGLHINTYEKYIQTDAAINSGNSGGALINSQGDLIGINSSLYSQNGGSNGIGFAIPVDIASYVLDSIVIRGRVVRGWLGVVVEEITPSLAEALALENLNGLVLTDIKVNSPAAKAGLQIGDIITHIDETPIVDGNLSMHSIAQTPPGQKISLRVLHQGAEKSFLVVIGQRPEKNIGRVNVIN